MNNLRNNEKKIKNRPTIMEKKQLKNLQKCSWSVAIREIPQQNGECQQNNYQQMLEEIWGKGKPLSLLLHLQTCSLSGNQCGRSSES